MALSAADPALPPFSPLVLRWFRWYCVRFARKHFHNVLLSKQSWPLPADEGRPLVFVLNHPSWWDLILGVLLSNELPRHRHYAPIDAEMLPKYGFFKRLGFFGIEQTPRGAARFLRTSMAIFAQPFGAMWVTAQGKFVDPRVRPIELRPGVGYVASKLSEGLIVPVALEYPFWNERTPEALVLIGEPLDLSAGPKADGREWTARIEEALTSTQDRLAAEAMQRDASLFRPLVSGKAGVGGVYDFWRRFKSWARGRRFESGHGVTEKPPVPPGGGS